MAGWLDVVRKVAPAVAGLIGGPGGMALKLLSQTFLGHPDGSEQEIGAAVMNDPDAVVKLRQIEADLERQRIEARQKMAELGLQLEQIEAGDRANARAREIAIKDWVPRVLALGVFALFTAALVLMHYHTIPAENREVATQLLEILKMSTILVLGYYFGSSSGSAMKTMLNQAGK